MSLDRIEDAVAAVAAGAMVVVVDDEDREDEGDLVMAADAVTPAAVAFFLEHTSGVICAPMPRARADDLDLPLMVAENTEPHRTAFTVTVDLKAGTTTGISADDRAATLRALADPATRAHDLNRPGHIFPLRAVEGGVLKRAGHTEAAVDLARLAGRPPVGVICEIVAAGRRGMARRPELEAFAREHGLAIVSIADLIRYRRRTERLVHPVEGAEAVLPTRHGTFRTAVFESDLDGTQHVVLWMGDPATPDLLVRVHSECLTGDTFGSLRCDCGPQLDLALARIASEGHGVVVYLRGQEGRGIGIGHKVRAYGLQDHGLDTVDANTALGLPVDSREYGVGAQILASLGVSSMRLMTNNPAKYGGLDGWGLTITGRVSLETEVNEHNAAYLRTKRERLGHLLAEQPPGAGMPADQEGAGHVRR